MGVFPNEKQQKWLVLLSLGLVVYFLVSSVLAFIDDDPALGTLFLVLAAAMIVAEIFRLRSLANRSRSSRSPKRP